MIVPIRVDKRPANPKRGKWKNPALADFKVASAVSARHADIYDFIAFVDYLDARFIRDGLSIDVTEAD